MTDAEEPRLPEDDIAKGYIGCACGCYHPVLPDSIGRREVRFSCPHPEHTLQGDSRTYTNPPNDGVMF